MKDSIYIPDGVNPHQGIEWQLMQKGEKKIALFALHHEALPSEFENSTEYESITVECDAHKKSHQEKSHQEKTRRRGAKQLNFKIFFAEDAKQDAEKLANIMQKCYAPNHKITAKHEKDIGLLLGYHPEHIDIYLEWVALFKKSLYLPKDMPKMKKTASK